MPRSSRTAPLLSGVLLSAALLTGCTQGPDAFNENLPGDEANPGGDAREVPRLPEAVPPGQEDPVIVVTRDPEPPVPSQEDAGRG